MDEGRSFEPDPKLDGSEFKELWKRRGEPEARTQLIAHYAPLIKSIADRVSESTGGAVEIGDLITPGVFGLVQAMERFDSTRGIPFEAYAAVRMRGEMIDHLRKEDWVPRGVREDAKAIQEAFAHLYGELGRSPSDEEMAEHLGMPREQLERRLEAVGRMHQASLYEPLAGQMGEGDITVEETLSDESGSGDPVALFEREETRAALVQALSRIPERERLVLSLYYAEELTLKEIGEVLGVTESRVCQVRGRAVARLRSLLRERTEVV